MDPPSHTISLPVNFFIYTQDYDEEIFGKKQKSFGDVFAKYD